MSSQQLCKMLMAVALLAPATGPLAADICDQLSPLKQELGDGYSDVGSVIEIANTPNTSLTANLSVASTEHADAIRVLELLDSRRHITLSGVRVDCRGVGQSLRQVEYDSTLRLTDYASHLSGDQTYRFVEKLGYERQTGGVVDNKIAIDRRSSSKQRAFNLELPDASEWLVHEKNGFSTSQINRVRNALGASYIQQIDTELREVSGGVQLSQTLYINGHRSTWASWTLSL